MRARAFARWGLATVAVAAAVGAIGACNFVVGIEDVEAGIACNVAADCLPGAGGGAADSVANAVANSVASSVVASVGAGGAAGSGAPRTCEAATCEKGVCVFGVAADGTACGAPGEACAGGACQCPPANQCGGTACVDLQNDALNCGACDEECLPRENCSEGQCVCKPENLCGDSCLDTSSTSQHCGECGHDCLGAACIDSVCDPRFFATDQLYLEAMVADADFLYVALGTGPINKIAKADGTVTELAVGGNFGPYGIAIDDSFFVYFTDFDPAVNGLFRALKDGTGGLSSLATAEDYPGTLFFDAGELFWSTASAIRKYRVQTTGPAEDVVVAAVGGHAVDGNHVYYTFQDRLERVPRPSGPAEVLATGLANPTRLTLDANFAYVVLAPTADQLTNMEAVGAVVRIPKSGGAPLVLADELLDPISVVVDDTHAYFMDAAEQTIRRVPKDGGQVVPFTRGFKPGRYLVFDDPLVYVIDYTNDQILTVPR